MRYIVLWSDTIVLCEEQIRRINSLFSVLSNVIGSRMFLYLTDNFNYAEAHRFESTDFI